MTRTLRSIDDLPPKLRFALAIGVFDGAHRGHQRVVDALLAAARRHRAEPVALTFDPHPSEIVRGEAPALLCNPDERITLLHGFGISTETTTACSAPMGYVPVTTDCDDADPGANPAAPEVCDGRDNDCDGMTDEGRLTTFYRDADGDGFGQMSMSMTACDRPTGYVADNTDCDDAPRGYEHTHADFHDYKPKQRRDWRR